MIDIRRQYYLTTVHQIVDSICWNVENESLKPLVDECSDDWSTLFRLNLFEFLTDNLTDEE